MNKNRLKRAGIDVDTAVERLAGDKDLFESLLISFSQDQSFQQLKKSLLAKDSKQAFEAAHCLKGLAGNLCLESLYTFLSPLVEELRDHRLEKASELFEKVSEAYGKITGAIQS